MKKILLMSLAFFLVLTPALAQTDEGNVDKVILASTENYPDALISGPVSEKLGIPVFLTERGELSSETESAINSYSPQEVIIVGGPAVVSEEVHNKLAQDYEVTRLWGMTRFGTSIEVASYFWPEGAEEAVLVQDDIGSKSSEILAESKQIAEDEESPVFLIPSEKVPADVLGEMQELGVKKTTLVGTNLGPQVREQVKSMGASVEEEIGGTMSQVREKLKERIKERTRERNKTRLLAVAVGNFKDSINANNFPNSSSYLVSSEEEIQELLDFLEGSNVETVKVVGKPDLAELISSTLEDETELTVDMISGPNSAGVASQMAEQYRGEIKRNFARRNREWEQKIGEKESKMKSKTNNTLRKAQSRINENSSQEAREALQKASNYSKERKYLEAYREAVKAMERSREERYKNIRGNWEQVEEEVEEERKSLQEKIQDLTQMNQQFGEQMSQNLTVKERLQVMNEFRGQRRNKVEELVDEAAQKGSVKGKSVFDRVKESMRGSGTNGKPDDKGKGSDKAGFSSDCGGVEESSIELKVQNSELEISGELSLPNPCYEMEDSLNYYSDSEEANYTMEIVPEDVDACATCLAKGEFEKSYELKEGNWTVNAAVNVDGQERARDQIRAQVKAEGSSKSPE